MSEPVEIVLVIEEDGNISKINALERPVTVKIIQYGTSWCDESLKEVPDEDTWEAEVVQGRTLDQLVAQIKEGHA